MLVPMLLLPVLALGQQAQWEEANEKVLEIYLNQGPKAAIPEAEEFLQRTEKDFGSSHLYYAYALHNLACIYGDWGNFKAAQPLEDQVPSSGALLLGSFHYGRIRSNASGGVKFKKSCRQAFSS